MEPPSPVFTQASSWRIDVWTSRGLHVTAAVPILSGLYCSFLFPAVQEIKMKCGPFFVKLNIQCMQWVYISVYQSYAQVTWKLRENVNNIICVLHFSHISLHSVLKETLLQGQVTLRGWGLSWANLTIDGVIGAHFPSLLLCSFIFISVKNGLGIGIPRA